MNPPFLLDTHVFVAEAEDLVSENRGAKSERKVWEDIGERDPYLGTSGPTRAIPKAGLFAKSDDSLFKVINPGAFVLDVGCGYGRNCIPLARLHGCHIVACDISSAMSSNVKEEGIPIILSDLRKLPFRSGAFDYLICSVVLIHLPRRDTATAITELRRVGRQVLIIMPNPLGPASYFGLLPVFAAFLVWVKGQRRFSILRDVPTLRGYLVNYYLPWRFTKLLKHQFSAVTLRSASGGNPSPYLSDRVLYVCTGTSQTVVRDRGMKIHESPCPHSPT